MAYPEQLQEYALAEITRRIQTGEYPVGSRLVAKTIADSLNISSTPVVAAINRLAAQGIVETIPRKGAVVKNFSPAEIRDYFETRTMMECYAANHITKDLDRYQDTIGQMRQAADRLAEMLVSDADMELIRTLETTFHTGFIKLVGNVQLDRLYKFNWSVGSVYFVYSIKKVAPENLQVSLREHQQILNTLLTGDTKRLETLVRDHLRFLNQAIIWYQ